VHDAPVPVPARLRASARPVVDRLGLAEITRDDLVVWGTAPSPLRLDWLAPPGLLVSPHAEVVARARRLGWEAVLVPELSEAVLDRALDRTRPVIPFERATLVPDDATVWTEGASTTLVGRERDVLLLLDGAEGAFVPAAALCAHLDATPEAVRAVVRRLRAKIGASAVTGEPRRGWCLRGPAARAEVVAPPAPPARGFEDVEVDGLGRQVWIAGRPVVLGEREASLVALLVDAAGRVVHRADAVRALGGASDVALDALVHRVRKKLGPRRLRTVRGQGWCLQASPAAVAVAETEPEVDVAAVSELLARHPVVTLVGPSGAGKSALIAAVASRLCAPVFDVRETDVARAVRWGARRDRWVLLDGFDDPTPHRDALLTLVCSERHLLVGARAPLGVAGERVVSLAAPLAPEISRIRSALARRPGASAGLAALGCFVGAFTAEDAAAVAPDLDLAHAVRHGLIVALDRGHVLGRGVRRALDPPDAAARDRWAVRVVAATEAAHRARPGRIDEVVARGDDLDAALDHLVARAHPAAVRAALLWMHVADWSGKVRTVARVAPLLAPPTRAELLLGLADAHDVDLASGRAMAEEALALGLSADKAWFARVFVAIRLPDPAASRREVDALVEAASDPEDPAPADVRALLDIVVAQRPEHTVQARRELLIDALARFEADRWRSDGAVLDVFLSDARAALLTELAHLAMR
ncbi:MAG: winged helix-turn-helix domain-containing protein, partial [Myxococcota bacterium]